MKFKYIYNRILKQFYYVLKRIANCCKGISSLELFLRNINKLYCHTLVGITGLQASLQPGGFDSLHDTSDFNKDILIQVIDSVIAMSKLGNLRQDLQS